ncbi:MAG TPA: response regulator transcription factor [Rectinemataceae bacterium]|nr:response regulator transcription factor [Rectinemataceae bacterium]
MRVLIVEDELKVASFIARGYEEEGMETVVAHDGLEGASLAESQSFDLIVLDLGLPGIDGFTFLERLRGASQTTPVLILTARDSLEDKVRGLETGADDYLPKPFAFEELLARSRALIRRAQGSQTPVLKVADLVLDQRSRRVRRGEDEIVLSNREYGLLEYLMSRARCVVSRTMIAEQVWGIAFETGTNTIDVYINYLRSKVDAGRELKLIRTVRGRGYCLTDEPEIRKLVGGDEPEIRGPLGGEPGPETADPAGGAGSKRLSRDS